MFSLLANLNVITHWLIIAGLVAGAVAAFLYLPGKLGGAIAAISLSAAVAVFAYDEGYRARGVLDQSAELRQQIAQRDAEIAEQNRQAAAARVIAAAAADRAATAEKQSADIQSQVDDYAQALAKRPANSGCALGPRDVDGLSAIGRPADPAKPPARKP